MISARGDVYRVPPFRENPKPFASLGEGFGSSPFVIRTVNAGSGGQAGDDVWLIAASECEIKALSLTSGKIRTLSGLPSNQKILAGNLRSGAGIEADSRHAYFFRKENGRTFLSCVDFQNHAHADLIDIEDEEIAGPVLAGDLVFAWSPSRWYAAGPVTLLGARSQTCHRLWFPAGFVPVCGARGGSWGDFAGRRTCMVSDSLVHIPGQRQGTSALFIVNACARLSEGKVLQLRTEASCWQGSGSAPTVTVPGRLFRAERGSLSEVMADPRIEPGHPSYSDTHVSAAFVRSEGKTKLRLALGDFATDLSLHQLSDFGRAVEICTTGNGLMLLYQDAYDETHIAACLA